MWRLDVRRFGSNYNSQDYTAGAHHRDLHPVLRHPLTPAKSGSRAAACASPPPTIACATWAVPSARRSAGSARTGSSPTKRKPHHGHEPQGWARHNWSRAIGYEHLMTRENAGSVRRDLLQQDRSARTRRAEVPELRLRQRDRPAGRHGDLYPVPQQARRHRMRLHRHPPGGGALLHHHRHRLRAARHVLAVAEHAGGRLGEHRGCRFVICLPRACGDRRRARSWRR